MRGDEPVRLAFALTGEALQRAARAGDHAGDAAHAGEVVGDDRRRTSSPRRPAPAEGRTRAVRSCGGDEVGLGIVSSLRLVVAAPRRSVLVFGGCASLRHAAADARAGGGALRLRLRAIDAECVGDRVRRRDRAATARRSAPGAASDAGAAARSGGALRIASRARCVAPRSRVAPRRRIDWRDRIVRPVAGVVPSSIAVAAHWRPRRSARRRMRSRANADAARPPRRIPRRGRRKTSEGTRPFQLTTPGTASVNGEIAASNRSPSRVRIV